MSSSDCSERGASSVAYDYAREIDDIRANPDFDDDPRELDPREVCSRYYSEDADCELCASNKVSPGTFAV